MKFPIDFKTNETYSSSLWTWGTCNHPKTLSFRANNSVDIVKTMNSVYINTPDSSYSSISSKTNVEEKGDDCAKEEESVEMVMKGLSSERFFFEVSGETSSILGEASNKIAIVDDVALVKESVAMEMESRDPFLDFRISMEEMVEANPGSLKNNWEFLEELLACYLKVNHKSNHGYIVGAFVDLLVKIGFSSSTNTNSLSQSTSSEDQGCCSSSSGGGHSFASPLSFYSSASSISPCLSSLMESEDEIEKENGSKSSSLTLSNV
ncbi:hypothetical protein LIER_22309 [Lithospermum erythrorhizon]|uniref:Transcription repressor n=1 Tax=Lithospermum erythrorhizon TaxID=34254 RepID=A0AAV3QXM1_LITER